MPEALAEIGIEAPCEGVCVRVTLVREDPFDKEDEDIGTLLDVPGDDTGPRPIVEIEGRLCDHSCGPCLDLSEGNVVQRRVQLMNKASVPGEAEEKGRTYLPRVTSDRAEFRRHDAPASAGRFDCAPFAAGRERARATEKRSLQATRSMSA